MKLDRFSHMVLVLRRLPVPRPPRIAGRVFTRPIPETDDFAERWEQQHVPPSPLTIEGPDELEPEPAGRT